MTNATNRLSDTVSIEMTRKDLSLTMIVLFGYMTNSTLEKAYADIRDQILEEDVTDKDERIASLAGAKHQDEVSNCSPSMYSLYSKIAGEVFGDTE